MERISRGRVEEIWQDCFIRREKMNLRRGRPEARLSTIKGQNRREVFSYYWPAEKGGIRKMGEKSVARTASLAQSRRRGGSADYTIATFKRPDSKSPSTG